MQYNEIILTTDDKTAILAKAREAGLDFRISCPDGLASFEKGIKVQWYGRTLHEKLGEVSQLQIMIKDVEPENINADTPVFSFIKSLSEPYPVSPENKEINKELLKKGIFAGIL